LSASAVAMNSKIVCKLGIARSPPLAQFKSYRCTPNIRPNLPDFGKSVATTPSISEGAGMSEPTELSDLVAYLVRTSRLTRSDPVRLVE